MLAFFFGHVRVRKGGGGSPNVETRLFHRPHTGRAVSLLPRPRPTEARKEERTPSRLDPLLLWG